MAGKQNPVELKGLIEDVSEMMEHYVPVKKRFVMLKRLKAYLERQRDKQK